MFKLLGDYKEFKFFGLENKVLFVMWFGVVDFGVVMWEIFLGLDL